MADKVHSSLGPSSAERWFNCPGSVALSEQAPKPKPSIHAAEGSVAHDIAERLVTKKTDELELMAMIGNTVEHDGHEVEITEEMLNGAVEYRDIIQEDTRALMKNARPAPIVGKAEARVKVSSVPSQALFGTLDYALYRKGHKLIIYDYKFGKGHAVEVEENKQLMIYLLGAMDTFAGRVFDECEIVIVQPRAPHRDGAERRCPVSRKEIEAFRKELSAAVAATMELEANIEPGNWCRWCPAKVDCPAMFNEVQKTAQADFSIVGGPSSKSLPSVETMPVEKLASALAWEDTISSWFEAVKNRAREILENGGEVPGFKLVDGRSNRKWVSESAAIQQLTPLVGKDALFSKPKLKTPAQVEKLVGKKKFAEFGLTEKPPGKKAVAPASDPRPPASSSAAEDFGPVTAELAGAGAVWPQDEK